jgi:23S rRNA G2069 N7-methylase RlmK/C1962 C5-methylase RlmI
LEIARARRASHGRRRREFDMIRVDPPAFDRELGAHAEILPRPII